MEFTQEQYQELVAENAALKCQVNEIKVYIGAALQQAFSKERDQLLHEARRLTPNKCLNSIKADAINVFFGEMISECSGSDNGVDAVIDEYINDNLLTPFKSHYTEKLSNEEST